MAAAPVTRRSRITGTFVTEGAAVDLDCDPTDGPWVTVCDEHGTLINSSTRALAANATGLDFCDECREAYEAKMIRVPGTKIRVLGYSHEMHFTVHEVIDDPIEGELIRVWDKWTKEFMPLKAYQARLVW